MRFSRLLPVLLLVAISAAAFASPPPRARVDQPFTLDLDCVWALALPAILDEYNGTQHETLEVDSSSLGDLGYWRHYLEPEWGITDGDSLQYQLSWLVRSGQSEEYDEIRDRLREFPDAGPENLAALFPNDPVRQAGARFILANPRPAGPGFTKGYDLGRCVQVVRWSYQAGIIDNRQAWSLIRSIMPAVRASWHSWEEFGQSYLTGRLFWLSRLPDSAKAMEIARESYRSLLAPGGWWTLIPWNPNQANGAFCQYLIGKMYWFGYGVATDQGAGQAWLDKAVAGGSAEARRLLAEFGPASPAASPAAPTPKPASLPAGDWQGRIKPPAHLDLSYEYQVDPQNPQTCNFVRREGAPDSAAAQEATVIALIGQLSSKACSLEDLFRRCGPPQRITVFLNGAEEYLSWWYGQVCFYLGAASQAVAEIRIENRIPGFDWMGLRVGDAVEKIASTIGPVLSTVNGRNEWKDNILYRDLNGQKGSGYFANSAKRVRVFLWNDQVAALYLALPGP